MRTIYMAADAQTAYAEATRYSQNLALQAMPIVATASINCLLENVLDVCDRAVQSALGTTEAELTAPYIRAQGRGELVPTQELSKAVFDSGLFQAIRYPSAQPTGTVCFVVYYERLLSPSFLELIDPTGAFIYRLPPQP